MVLTQDNHVIARPLILYIQRAGSSTSHIVNDSKYASCNQKNLPHTSAWPFYISIVCAAQNYRAVLEIGKDGGGLANLCGS